MALGPDILVLQLRDGTLLIGPPLSLKEVAPEAGDDGGRHRWRLRTLIAHHVEPWRLRRAALAWGIDHPHRRHWSDHEMQDQVAHWVETGQLGLRFAPLFRNDRRHAAEAGRLSLYQIDKGLPPAAAPPAPRMPALSPPQAMLVRGMDQPEMDFIDEVAQADTLKNAADDGTPFCAICEALKAAKRAAA